MINVIDGFLPSYEKLKKYAETAAFENIENPVDGVVYPHVCKDIPEDIKLEFCERIKSAYGLDPKNITIFMRRTPEGEIPPQIFHHDLSMGAYTAILYMDDSDVGGTATVCHIETGMCYGPSSETFVHIARGDQNNLNKWRITSKAQMKQNRLAIFESGYFHCALPIGGFGNGNNARTVLTMFFS